MVYNTSNTRFASRTELYHITPDATRIRWYEWLEEKATEADKANTFGGKRLLGVTDKGNPMWVTMTIERDTLEMTIKLTKSATTPTAPLPKTSAKASTSLVNLVNNLPTGILS